MSSKKRVSVIITCQEDEGNANENLSSEEYDQLVKVINIF